MSLANSMVPLTVIIHVYDQNVKGSTNSMIVIVTTIALIDKTRDKHLKHIDLKSSYWRNSLFMRMGFFKYICTTSKPDILKAYCRSQSLILNFDKTPLKYTPVSNCTLLMRKSKNERWKNQLHELVLNIKEQQIKWVRKQKFKSLQFIYRQIVRNIKMTAIITIKTEILIV